MNADKIRKDFPVLGRELNRKTPVYMDSACMSLKPVQVIEAMNEYYRDYPACAGRSSHKLGSEATENYEKARKEVAKFISAKPEEIIFTKNTTEGINLASHAIGFNSGDVILTSDREHNSNLVPWQMLGSRGVKHAVIRSGPDESFDLEALQDSIGKKTRLVSVVHVSNIDGYEMPVKEIVSASKDAGALTLIDGAQSVPHTEVNVKKIGCDFLSFSGHKMLGPSIGVLFARKDAQDGLVPFMTGGETVESTTYADHKFLKPPHVFEAGLQNYAGAIGLAAACRYLGKTGMSSIEKHERSVSEKLRDEMSPVRGIEFVGRKGSGIVSFNVGGMGFHDVAVMLDELDNVMIRSGQHCAHSWFSSRSLEGCCRASLYLYNNAEDVERFSSCLKKVAGVR